MNKKLRRWEHEGWVGVKHRDILRCVAAELKARKAPTFFKEAKPGTPERAECKKAARLAKRAARAPTIEAWDMTLPPGMALPGLSLIDNRQKLFYRSIREEKTKKLAPRASTDKKLKVIRDGVHKSFGRHVSDADIWNSIRTKDFLPRPAQFLWKSIHNAHKIGSYWTHIPECEERAVCKDCDMLEDLEHILVGCGSPGQELIWEAAKTLWLEKETTWPEVSLGTILGCGLADFRDDSGKIDRGAQRLYWILMSESAYQIWRLRNERVIDREGVPASEEEIMNKFKFAVNQRLQMDKVLANRPRKGKRPALAPKLVLETWSKTLDDEQSLPTDWLREPRVLVGSRAFPPRTLSRRHDSRGIG
jgi:ribonuclease HI